MQLRSLILSFFVIFLALQAMSQENPWRINPKVLNDTIEAHFVENQGIFFVAKAFDELIDQEGNFWSAG